MSEAAAGEKTEKAKDWSPPGAFEVLFYWAVWLLASILARLYFRLSIRGYWNIPKSGPVIVVANHSSHLDPPLIGGTLPRRMIFLAKAELFEGAVLGRAITWLGAFPIKRGGGDRAAIRAAVEVLRKGNALLMFPEGNRSLDGELREAKTGVAMLLQQVPEATIVPVRIEGTFEAMPPRGGFPRPRKVRLTVGKPFLVSDLERLPGEKKQLYQELGRQIMKRIADAEP